MSKKPYLLDATSMQLDPNMSNLFLYPGSHIAAHESETGKCILSFLMSRMGVAVLMGAVIAAPSRPPVIATEPYIAMLVGETAFTDEMKKYTGRMVRQIVEHLGARWVRRGVKVTVSSRYGSGSIYKFGSGIALERD